MRKRNRSDYLLIEILIAVLFLMLTLTVLVQVFAKAKKMAGQAQAQTQALSDAQNIAEALHGSEDPDAILAAEGFVSSHGVWTQNFGEYTLSVSGAFESLETGVMWNGSLTAYLKDKDLTQQRQEGIELFTLPCVWYRGV